MGPHLSGKRLKLCAKYGRPGRSIRCETPELSVPVRPPPVGSAFVGRLPQARAMVGVEVEQSFLFLRHMQFESVIRLRLVEAGGGNRTVARCDVCLLPPQTTGDQKSLSLSGVGVGADRR